MMRQTSKFKEKFMDHFQEHIGLYLFLIILLVVGVIFGAIAVKAMQVSQKEALLNYLQGFLGMLVGQGGIEQTPVLSQVLLQKLQIALLIWFAGLIIIGIPVVIAIVFIEGFVIGFTVGFLVEEMSWKGFMLALVAIFPQNLFAVPALIMLAAGALSFSMLLVRRRLFTHKQRLRQEFWGYSFYSIGVSLILVLAGFIETYFCPVFMRLVGTYLM